MQLVSVVRYTLVCLITSIKYKRNNPGNTFIFCFRYLFIFSAGQTHIPIAPDIRSYILEIYLKYWVVSGRFMDRILLILNKIFFNCVVYYGFQCYIKLMKYAQH